MYVIKEPKEFQFDKIGHKGKRFSTDHAIENSEFLILETQVGLTETLRENKSEFVYYILEGKGTFIIDGNKESCSKGDLVVIPLGKTFTYKGKLRLLLVATPPWKDEQEETL